MALPFLPGNTFGDPTVSVMNIKLMIDISVPLYNHCSPCLYMYRKLAFM